MPMVFPLSCSRTPTLPLKCATIMPSSQLLRFLVVLLFLSLVPKNATARDDFRVVLLSDTQFYSESFPETYMTQLRWIKDRAESDRIKFVIHLGDIVQNPDAENEWENADRAHRILDGVVPYSVLPGNHDLAHENGRTTHNAPLYNKYFPVARFEKYSWYGGHQGQTNANNYCFFEAGGAKYLILSLEYAPTDITLEWAGNVIARHPDHRVILATHCYMRPAGRDCICGGKLGNSGQEIWSKLVRKHGTIFLVVSGHVLGVAHQTSTNDAGGKVHEILCDYQGHPNGGNGWLQILHFVPAQSKLYVEAYSPLLQRSNKDPQHTYVLSLNNAPIVATAPSSTEPAELGIQTKVGPAQMQ